MSVQKIIHLFKQYQKNFIKEQRFVYLESSDNRPAAEAGFNKKGLDDRLQTAPTPEQAKLAQEAAAKKEAETKAAQERGKTERQEKGQAIAKNLVPPKASEPIKSELDKTLDTLDQSKFDKIMKDKITGDKIDGTLTKEQVTKLITFAEKTDPDKNLQTIYKSFIKDQIKLEQMEDKSFVILLNYFKNKKDSFNTIVELLLIHDQNPIKIEADNGEIINLIYDKIKTENRFRGFDGDTLGILLNKLTDTNLNEFLNSKDFPDNKKGECLKSKFTTKENKQKLLANLIGTKTNLAEIETSAMNAIITYLCTENSGELMKTIYGKFNQNTVKKVDLPAAKALLPILSTNPNTNEQTLYRYMLSDLQLSIKKDIVNDKTMDKKIRRDLFDSIDNKDRGTLIDPDKQIDNEATTTKTANPEAQPGGPKDEKAPDSDKGKKVATKNQPDNTKEVDSESTDLEKLIKGTNLKFDGKKLSWTFDLIVKGEKVQSGRNFRVREEFKAALAKVDHSTPEKVQLFAYKWLLDKAYKGGEIKDNKYKVDYFDESQKFLIDEIARLTKITEKQIKPVKKDSGTKPGGAAEEKPPKVPATGESPAKTGEKPAEGGVAAPEAKPAKTEKADEKPAEKDTDQVKDFAAAKADLITQGYGKITPSIIESNEPNSLTNGQFKTLGNTLIQIKEIIKNGKELEALSTQLINLVQTAKPILDKSSIKKITINANEGKNPIVWDLTNNDLPFGDVEKFKANVSQIKEAEVNPREYKNFQKNTADKKAMNEKEGQGEAKRVERTKQYRAKYKELSGKKYDVKIGKMSEEEMVKNWTKMANRRRVDFIMRQPPFFFNENGEVAKKAAKIITEWSNKVVEFNDVLVEAKKTASGISEDTGKFTSEFETLLKKQEAGTLTNPTEQKKLDQMFTEVIIPCLDLLAALEALEPPKEIKEVGKKEGAEKGYETSEALTEEQKEIRTGLYELCTFQSEKDAPSWWTKILGHAMGAKDQLTMSDLDGKTAVISQGMFRDHYDPRAAYAIMTNINEDKNADGESEHYKIDDKGTKSLDKTKMLQEVNERLKLGVINMVMAEAGQKDSKIPKDKIGATIESRTKALEITDFKKLSEDQKTAFQLGFILKEASKFAKYTEDATDKIKNHPVFKEITAQLLAQNTDPEIIKKIQENLLFGVGVSLVKVNDENWKLDGIGGGTTIKINDRISVVIGAGISKSQANGVLGLDLTIYNGDTVQAHAFAGIDGTGIEAAVGGTFKLKYVNIHAGVGAHASFNLTDVMLGGSIGASWNMENQLQRDTEKAQAKTNYTPLWNEWSKMDKNDIEGKFAALQKIAPIWEMFKDFVEKKEMSHADVVNTVESLKEQLTAEILKNLESPIPFISYIGIGFVGGVPVPQIGFKLGSVVASVPNRREISKIMGETSATVMQAKMKANLKKAVEEIDEKKKPVEQQAPKEEKPLKKAESVHGEFNENIGKLVYSPRDGKMMSLIAESHVDLKEFHSNPSTYNEAMKKTAMKIEAKSNGMTELKIFDKDMKDVEIHVDPLLKDTALIIDNGKLLLEGDISDLVISRERFTFPLEITEGSASMRDVITIRQRPSVENNRDSTWIQKYEVKFLQQLEGESGFSLEKGINYNEEKDQDSIKEKPGISAKEAKEVAKEVAKDPQLTEVAKKHTNLNVNVDKAFIDQFNKLYKERVKQSLADKSAMDEKKYNAMPVRKMNDALDKLLPAFPKKTPFANEFRANISDTPKLITILKEYADKTKGLENLNEKEINTALAILINNHFTYIYGEAAEAAKHKADGNENLEGNEKALKAINGRILEGLNGRINFFKDEVFGPKFKEVIENMNPKPGQSADELVDQLLNDIYSDLLKSLSGPDEEVTVDKILNKEYDKKQLLKLGSPDFDFRNIKVDPIAASAEVFSGTREYEEGKTDKKHREGVLSENLNFVTEAKDKKLVLAFGLMSETTGNYDPKSDMGRVIFEISSPLPQKGMEFLNSPLALKFKNVKGAELLCYNDKTNNFDDYQKISEIYAKPELLKSSAPHQEAFERYKETINKIRECELSGETFVKTLGNTGISIEITMTATIKHGAYSECANATFTLEEVGHIVIKQEGENEEEKPPETPPETPPEKPKPKIVTVFNTTNEIIDPNLNKNFASFVFGAAFRTEKTGPEGGGGGSVTQSSGDEEGSSTKIKNDAGKGGL